MSDRLRVVFNPGHGGKDPGTIGPRGTREKDINLIIARMVARILAPSVDVVMTRTADINLTLDERTAIANNLKADLYVSIHCNGFDRDSANGTETLYFDSKDLRASQSKTLATCIQHRLKTLARADRGVKAMNLHEVRETKMPAAIAEIAFLTNPEEEALLLTQTFQEQAAMSIAKGIADYIGVALYIGPAINVKGKVFQGRMIDGVLHAPLRAMMEHEGYTVHWDSEWQMAHVSRPK